MRKTKIVVTLGPSTDDLKTIQKLIKKGVNVFRLNFSHANYDYHKSVIDKIRQASKAVSKEVAILQDIAGPKIRISHLNKPIELKNGDILTLSKEKTNEEKKTVTVSYSNIIDGLNIGDPVYFSDGTIRAKVIEKNDLEAKCEIIVAGTLQSKKGMNLPKSNLNISAITQKDKEDLEFGAKNGVDIVALSFVGSCEDIKQAKQILENFDSKAMIFAKIEKQEAIKNIKSIIKEADGIMVARGDLGVELGLKKVPMIQKKIITKALKYGKPTITATQMLTSMINSAYPTRAEISDIANAVLDGSDAVMLSDETTIGKYPLKAVEVLNETILETEKCYPYHFNPYNVSKEDSIAAAVTTLSQNIKPDALITFSASGRSVISISKFRPKERIIVSSFNIETIRKLQVVWGVDALFLTPKIDDVENLIKTFLNMALEYKNISKKKKYVLTVGYHLNAKDSTSQIRVLDKQAIEYIL